MRIIAVEEHFSTEEYYKFLEARNNKLSRKTPVEAMLLKDLGEGRLKEMDKHGLSMQVLSLSESCAEYLEETDPVNWARKANDELASLIKKSPDRYAGFAALRLEDPVTAADELERAVRVLGLKGATVHSHFKTDYFDDKKYWAIFEKAQSLNVPIYLHPMPPSADMIKPYLAYPGLERAMAGYGAETLLHALRLMLSGLFDEYPKLKIILGHLGEALPFWVWRLDNMQSRQKTGRPVKRKISEYLRDNFYISTSGMFSIPTLMCVYMTFGADHLLFAVDYPYELNEPAIKFLKDAPVCDADKEKIYHLNAESLLSL